MRLIILPAVGLEPTRGYPQQILSLHRLPFRHAGVYVRPVLTYSFITISYGKTDFKWRF